MKNIQNWKISNRYAAIVLMICSTFNIIFFYCLSLFTDKVNENIIVAFLIVEFIILFYLTEKKISNNETD